MAQNDPDHIGRQSTPENRTMQNTATNRTLVVSLEDEMLADVDEPPDLERTPRPSVLKLHESFKASFSKYIPRREQKESLLTSALHSNASSPIEEIPDGKSLSRGMSCVSTWSNNSASTAELTSDGGFTSPGTRTSTPSPPLPPATFRSMVPTFEKNMFKQPLSIFTNEDEHIGPLQKTQAATGETGVEASLGRKRCITFACGRKDEKKPTTQPAQPTPPSKEATEPAKRVCTIKFACPSKVSSDALSKSNKPRLTRAGSPAPAPHRSRASPKAPKAHRDSDSTVRNSSPVSVRKVPAVDRTRRLSINSDLARCEAFRFHEFASSEEEVDEWTQESTCHRNRLTVKDTLHIENNLRQLAEEAEEEAVDDEEEFLDDDDEDDAELDDDDDDDDLLDEEDDNDSDAYSDATDEGFQTDDEQGFAVSDDESDAGSDYNWWAPGPSTAATSVDHLEHIRPKTHRSASESSIESDGSGHGFRMPKRSFVKRKKSRPVNIRVPSPELPDSTDFVCGTLDEDRPLEDAYMSCLERRRAAKHKATPQDIDPTFPQSDPEMDEEDEDDEPEQPASEESDQGVMMHGTMDLFDGETRGRRGVTKRSPAQSPKRLRSPPPAKRTVHRSPPPRKLFGNSPRRLRSPAAPVRLRSPPPTRRGSANVLSPQQRTGLSIRFAGIGERPALTTSSSLPRTPVTTGPRDYFDEEDTVNEMPVRRAIDIKLGLEKKRQRRREQLYKKQHRKNTKDKRPPPGRGCERMREMGLGLAAHKGKATGFAYQMPPTPDQKDIHVLSV